jgi:hypothetical protein
MDPRVEVSDEAIAAWHMLIGDLAYSDARTAVVEHYRESPDRVMGSDIHARVKAIREARLVNVDQARLMEDVDPDDGRAWVAELQARLKAIADGAMEDPPRYLDAGARLRAVEA